MEIFFLTGCCENEYEIFTCKSKPSVHCIFFSFLTSHQWHHHSLCHMCASCMDVYINISIWCLIISNWSCLTWNSWFLKLISQTVSPLVFYVFVSGTNTCPIVQTKNLRVILHSFLSLTLIFSCTSSPIYFKIDPSSPHSLLPSQTTLPSSHSCASVLDLTPLPPPWTLQSSLHGVARV